MICMSTRLKLIELDTKAETSPKVNNPLITP